MPKQTDQTEYIVLGISLIITALCGYLGYIEYTQKQNLQNQLKEKKDALTSQKEEVQSLKTKLENVSSTLGWDSRHLHIPPEEEGENQEKRSKKRLQGYPPIEDLEDNNNLIQYTREIMKENGYSGDRIDTVTANEVRAKQFLHDFYRTNIQRTSESITDQLAISTFLNNSHYLVPIVNNTPVSAGTLGENKSNEKRWTFSGPNSENMPLSGIPQGNIESSGTTVSQLLNELVRIHNGLSSELEMENTELESTRKSFYSYVADVGDESQVPSYISESKQEVETLRQQVKNLMQNVQEKRDQLVNVQGEIDQKIYQKKREKSKLLNQQTQELIDQQAKITELQQRLKDLRTAQKRQEQPDSNTVDGQILSANQNASVAFINIGRTDGLFIGREFEVFNTIKGGRKVQKGQIKVVELFDDYARAKILNQDDPVNKPIESNDYIQNKEFRRGQTKSFVFAGQFSGDYNENVLKQTIRDYGHTVNSEVTINTNYLVIGEGYENQSEYKKAVELNVNTISAENLKHLFNLKN